MKRHLFFALAAFGMVACMQEEVVTVQQDAISFKGAFVDNVTRTAEDPSKTWETIQDFNVWGFMDQPDGNVFTGDKVWKAGDNWTYANTQYWAPNHTYYFAAVSPAESANWGLNTDNVNTYGPGVLTFTNENGSEDLLYAAASVTTPRVDDYATWGMEPVKFHFSHLLSKVKFTFTNGFATDNASLKVTDIKMYAPKTATIDLAVENWWDNDDWTLGDETVELAFGDVAVLQAGQTDECAKERLTIPVTKNDDYKVEFTVTLYTGALEALEYTKTTTISGVALEMGKAYNFAAEINPENLHLPSIEFSVEEVKDWVTGETDAQVQDAELRAALLLGQTYTLPYDVEVSEPLVVPAGMKAVLNLNGKTLKNNVANAATDVILVEEGAELTINGEGTVEAVSGNDGYTVISNGKVTINGGTYKSGKDVNGEPNAVIYARGKGQVYVNGGYFPNDHNSVYVLNKKDADRATTVIEVRGGTFKNFDPANNAAENAGTNFCAEGYTSYQDGEYYIVVNGVIVKTADEFKAAAANAGIENIIVAADLDFGTEFVNVVTDKVIIGNGHKFNAGGKTTKNYALGIQKPVNVTVNNLVMLGGGGIYVSAGANVEVNNVTLQTKYSTSGRNMFYVSNATLTVNSGNFEVLNTGIKYIASDYNAKVYVKGGTWEDLMAKNQTSVYCGNGGTVEISGGKFQVGTANYQFDPTPWLATGYKADRVGNYMVVSAE